MKGQWGILFALVIVLIIAIFSVINVDPVTVNYLFGTSEWPLILVIIVSALLGALLVGFIGIFRVYRLQRELKSYRSREKTTTPAPVSAPIEMDSKKEEINKTRLMNKNKSDDDSPL